jgi:hypothetical protein
MVKKSLLLFLGWIIPIILWDFKLSRTIFMYLSSNMFNGNFPKGSKRTFSNGKRGMEEGIFFGSTSNRFFIESSII